MKNIKIIMFIALLIFSIVPAYGSEAEPAQATITPDITVMVDKEIQIFYDGSGNAIYPISYNGTTYLPVRSIGAMLGKNIQWSDSDKTIYIEGNITEPQNNYKTAETSSDLYSAKVSVAIRPDITIKIDGNAQNFTDGKGAAVYPLSYNWTTYLPVRSVGSVLGKDVNWDNSERVIYIGEYLTDIKDIGKKVDFLDLYENCVQTNGNDYTLDTLDMLGDRRKAICYDSVSPIFPLLIETKESNEKNIIYDIYFLKEKDDYSLIIKKNLCSLFPSEKYGKYNALITDIPSVDFIYSSDKYHDKYEKTSNTFVQYTDMTDAMVSGDIAEYAISLNYSNYRGASHLDINIDELQKLIFEVADSDGYRMFFSIDAMDIRTVIKE